MYICDKDILQSYKKLFYCLFFQDARIFFSMYKAEDVYRVRIPGESSSTWAISPPSKEALIEDLVSQNDIQAKFRYSFTR